MMNKEIFPGSLSVLSKEVLNTYRFSSKKINRSQLLKVTALGLMATTGVSCALASGHDLMMDNFSMKPAAYATDGVASEQWNQPSEHVWENTPLKNDLTLFIIQNIYDNPISYLTAYDVLDGSYIMKTNGAVSGEAHLQNNNPNVGNLVYAFRVINGKMTTTGSKFMARAEAYHPDSVTSFGLYVGAEEGKQATFTHTSVLDNKNQAQNMSIEGGTFGVLATRNGTATMDFSKNKDGFVNNGIAAVDGGTINFTVGTGLMQTDVFATDGGIINMHVPAGTWQGSTENYSHNSERNAAFAKADVALGLGFKLQSKGQVSVDISDSGTWQVTKDSWLDQLTMDGGTLDIASYNDPNGSLAYRRVTTNAITSNVVDKSGTVKIRIDMKNESKTNVATDQLIITDSDGKSISKGSYSVAIDFTGADLQKPKRYSENFLIRYGTDGVADTTNMIGFDTGELSLSNSNQPMYFSPNGATYTYRLAYFDDQNKLLSKEERDKAGSKGTHGYWHLVLVGDYPEPEPQPQPQPQPQPDPNPNPGPQPEPEPGPSPEPNPDPSPDPDPEPSPQPSPGPVPQPKPPVTPEVDMMQNVGTSYGQYLAWRSDLTDLRHRLGEVRYGSQTGAWAKGIYDRERGDGVEGSGFKQETYGIHFGADTQLENKNWLVGASLRFSHSDQKSVSTIGNGEGDLDAYSAKVYASYVNKTGLYADFVATMGIFNQDISGRTNQNDGRVKADYKTYGYGVSAETGYHLPLGEGFSSVHQSNNYWFIEPQVQLAYYRIDGKDWRTSTGMHVSQDNVDSLIGRAGVVVGQTINFGGEEDSQSRYLQLSARAGVIHEFMGKQDVELNKIYNFEADLGGTSYYYGLEADWQFARNQRVYVNLDREEGSDYTKDISLRFGYRFSF